MGAAGVTAALAACTAEPMPVPLPTSSPTPTVDGWGGPYPFSSGNSCQGAANGEFATWRGRESLVHATWGADGATTAFLPGNEYGAWTGNMDYAPQYAFASSGGFTWQACADGAYDAKFEQDLIELRDRWGDRPGTIFYRFQHEFNGTWMAWSVRSNDDAPAFVAGWRRFASIFRRVFVGDDRYKLVWSPNAGVETTNVRDIRDLYPGSGYVDIIGIDYYDFFRIQTDEDWNKQVGALDKGGGPLGIGAWTSYASLMDKPIALAEWGQQFGDNVLFFQKIHSFIFDKVYTGEGSPAGLFVYEIYFNQALSGATLGGEGDFQLEIGGQDNPARPLAAQAYRMLWGEADKQLTKARSDSAIR
jgi:hypothetical protein